MNSNLKWFNIFDIWRFYPCFDSEWSQNSILIKIFSITYFYMTFDTNWDCLNQMNYLKLLTSENFTPVLILNEWKFCFFKIFFITIFFWHSLRLIEFVLIFFIHFDIWHRLRLPKSNLHLFHIFDVWRFYPWIQNSIWIKIFSITFFYMTFDTNWDCLNQIWTSLIFFD